MLRLVGIDWSERSSSSREILLLFSAMRILVSPTILTPFSAIILTLQIIAGLTVGDPVYRTGNPLSVELGPGISFIPI